MSLIVLPYELHAEYLSIYHSLDREKVLWFKNVLVVRWKNEVSKEEIYYFPRPKKSSREPPLIRITILPSTLRSSAPSKSITSKDGSSALTASGCSDRYSP